MAIIKGVFLKPSEIDSSALSVIIILYCAFGHMYTMYFHLLLFCLQFYFGTSTRLSSQLLHTERRMVYPVQLGTLELPRSGLDSAHHWSRPSSSYSNVNEVQRPMLVARAGGGEAVLDKQFNKKISKAIVRWEKSLNGNTLNLLLPRILALPYIQVTQCLFLMAGHTQKDIFVDQFAALESLLKIISREFADAVKNHTQC